MLNFGCASAWDYESLAAAQYLDSEDQDRALAANPFSLVQAGEVYHYLKTHPGAKLSAAGLEFDNESLLGEPKSLSVKLKKGMEYSFHCPGLYLTSGTLAGFGDLCPWASQGCRKNCLLVSGQRMMKDTPKDLWFAPELAKQLRAGQKMFAPCNMPFLRTYLYMFGPEEFRELFHDSLEYHNNYALNNGLTIAVRLNATSDVPWEDQDYKFNRGWSPVLEYPEIQFYDYTKDAQRAVDFAMGRFPENYYLTFSYSEISMAWCLILLRLGMSVTVPFDDSLGFEKSKDQRRKAPVLPKTAFGYTVVDGDKFDMRFFEASDYWDQKGFGLPPYVTGLRIKGGAQRRTPSLFFFSARDAEIHDDEPMFLGHQVYLSTKEALRQRKQYLLPGRQYLDLLQDLERQNFLKAIKESGY